MPTLEVVAEKVLKDILGLARGIVAQSLQATPQRLVGLEFIVGLYRPIVLEIQADAEQPGSLNFKFPELLSSRSQVLAPPSEHQHIESTNESSIGEVASILSMRYHYLARVEQDDSDNETALMYPVMAASFLQRDFPDFSSHIRLVPGQGLSFVIDGYSYVDLRKILASLTWIRV